MDKVLCDYSFEEDDNNNIYWVITVCEPTISYWALKPIGIVLLNPETGENKFVSSHEIQTDSAYYWIDRVYPANLVSDYINYWGALKDGWWNSVWGKKNILAGETPTMNYSANGNCVFVTPITSVNNKDQSMSGLIYTDARTGNSTYYTMSGGATEAAIIEAVNNTIKYKGWHASEQIVYENIFGTMSAIVPILSETGKNYMGLAIVETGNKRVAISENSTQDALTKYQTLIVELGGNITTESTKNTAELIGKVLRLGWDIVSNDKVYYIYLDTKRDKAFKINGHSDEMALTTTGDEVKLKFIESDESPIVTLKFENLTLNFKYSKNQTLIDSTMNQNKLNVSDKKDVIDFKDKLNNMSDEEIKKLMKK